MATLVTILVVLFLVLIVLVPLLEKYAKKGEPGGRVPANLTRFLFPMLMVMVILQLVYYYFG